MCVKASWFYTTGFPWSIRRRDLGFDAIDASCAEVSELGLYVMQNVTQIATIDRLEAVKP